MTQHGLDRSGRHQCRNWGPQGDTVGIFYVLCGDYGVSCFSTQKQFYLPHNLEQRFFNPKEHCSPLESPTLHNKALCLRDLTLGISNALEALICHRMTSSREVVYKAYCRVQKNTPGHCMQPIAFASLFWKNANSKMQDSAGFGATSQPQKVQANVAHLGG